MLYDAKLIRRSPSLGPISCTSVTFPPWRIPTKKKKFSFTPLSSSSSSSSSMASITLVGGLSITTESISLSKALVSSSSSPSFGRFTSSSCRCSLDSSKGISPARAWVDGFQIVSAATEGSSTSDCEEKPARVQRRQRSSSQSGGGGLMNLPGNPDLFTIPVDKGIGGVAELKKLYRDKFFGKSSEKMVDYLQSSVGSFTKIIRRALPHSSKRVLMKNVGKSTFLQRIANETLELRDLVEERESSGGIKPLRLMERSVFSDRMVFVRAVHEAKWMNEMEISIYDSWFDPVVSTLPGLIPDGFIYLRACPDTCHKRMMGRRRSEEGGVHWIICVIMSSIWRVVICTQVFKRYARQVAEFFEFVKKKNEAASPVAGDSGEIPKQPVVIPHKGLWVPGGKHFPESALGSPEFRRAMSLFSG
ncbi:hypothetical protein MKX01_019649 [Papaver californicum]|nr:hypothetical protein MKX01_019649 [Papaver californicum]